MDDRQWGTGDTGILTPQELTLPYEILSGRPSTTNERRDAVLRCLQRLAKTWETTMTPHQVAVYTEHLQRLPPAWLPVAFKAGENTAHFPKIHDLLEATVPLRNALFAEQLAFVLYELRRRGPEWRVRGAERELDEHTLEFIETLPAETEAPEIPEPMRTALWRFGPGTVKLGHQALVPHPAVTREDLTDDQARHAKRDLEGRLRVFWLASFDAWEGA